MSGRNDTLLALLASAGLAGCAGSQAAAVPVHAAPAPAQHPWTKGGLTQKDLLYVTNADNEVTVYNYANQTLVGVLTGFSQPMGDCSDTSGNVYVTDYTAQQIVEYAHGVSEPIEKLSDTPDHPYACSVDPKTGNLAVANDDGTSQQGNIAIWQHGSGSPTLYTDSKAENFESCAYDSNGNLFATSGYAGYGYQTSFAWLPSGGSKLVSLNVPGPNPSWKWSGVFGVGWDGKFFVIDASTIYRIALTHGQAFYVSEIQLTYDEEQGENGPYVFYLKTPTTEANAVIAGANGDDGASVNYWAYTAGGAQTAEIAHGVDRPFGVAISLRKR